jgi:hypothetical protein
VPLAFSILWRSSTDAVLLRVTDPSQRQLYARIFVASSLRTIRPAAFSASTFPVSDRLPPGLLRRTLAGNLSSAQSHRLVSFRQPLANTWRFAGGHLSTLAVYHIRLTLTALRT